LKNTSVCGKAVCGGANKDKGDTIVATALYFLVFIPKPEIIFVVVVVCVLSMPTMQLVKKGSQ